MQMALYLLTFLFFFFGGWDYLIFGNSAIQQNKNKQKTVKGNVAG